jgi:Ca2+-binding EF-hand superfamily protein
MLSEIQTKKLTYYFGLYDYDKDGYITEADLKKITANIAELRGWKPGWQIYDAAETVMMSIWRHVRSFIASNEEKGACLKDWLAHEEYMLQSEERYQEYAVQMTEGVFDILDEDGDGILTAENYRMLFLIFGMPGELANDSFNQIDLDHDGRIDLKDIHQSVREFHCSNNIDDPGNFMFGPWNSESDH